MRKYKLILPLLMIIICLFTLHFIDVNVKKFDLRFYNGKDNGLSSYFEISIITIIFMYIDLFRNILLAVILSLFYGIISFISIYLLFNTDDLIKIAIVHLIFSLLPIFVATFIRNGSYLNLEFKVANFYILLVYLLFLEIVLRSSMESSLLELLG